MSRPLTQFNEYGCGVFAVMNALRTIYSVYPPRYMYYQIEEELDTDEEYGTEEAPMIKKLRKDFFVTTVRSFDQERMDEWLDRGESYQVIVLYPWAFVEEGESEELHYCNITEKRTHTYIGANFYSTRFGFRHWVFKDWAKRWFDHPSTVVIYLRRR